MIDINWPLLGLAVLLFEAATGGLLTANMAGAGHAAGKAGGSAIAASARAAYATRAVTLQESATGRWRLKAEAKAGRLGKALGLAAWRFGLSGVAVATQGIKAAIAAAPGGAAKGRDIRRRVISSAKDAARTALARTEKPGEPVPPDRDPADEEPPAERVADDAPAPGDEDWSGDPWIEGPEASAPICGACKEPIKDGLCACGMFARWPKDDTTSAPDTPGRGTEEPVSSNTNLGAAAEKVGVVKYLAAWDGEEGGLELISSTLDALKDRIVKAGEANQRHDPDGVTDIAGKVDAAIQALLAAGEAIDGHAKALHQKWDSTVEHAKGTGAESADELLGAH